jgi:hypothetical protein
VLRRFALGALTITVLTAAATSTATLLEISADVAIIRQGEKIPDIEGVLDDATSIATTRAPRARTPSS